MSFYVVDCLTNGLNLLGFIIRDFNVEFLFKFHDSSTASRESAPNS